MSVFKTMVLGLCLSVPMLAGATTTSFYSSTDLNAPSATLPFDGTGSAAVMSTAGATNFSDIIKLSVTSSEVADITFANQAFGGLFDITGFLADDLTNGYTGLNFANLGMGDYVFQVTGTSAGISGGLYTVNTVVSAIPVPAAVWFMGSAMVGLFSFRKRKIALAA
ncbi:MAG: hypothetical protein HOP02_11455 [Methylococcaceae bacterium]|nr:hypothetical protein [Methylococcaceae bacterium]